MPAPSSQDVFKDTPPSLDYFVQQWLKTLPSTKMQYLEGWQQDPHDPSYNVPLAYLSNMKPAIQWEDVGPAGARWHGYSTTPGGQDLKAPWHPSAMHNDVLKMRMALDKLKAMLAQQQPGGQQDETQKAQRP